MQLEEAFGKHKSQMIYDYISSEIFPIDIFSKTAVMIANKKYEVSSYV